MALDYRSNFKVISAEQKSELRSVGQTRKEASPIIGALMNGELVTVEVEDGTKIAGLYQSAKVRNFKMTARKVFLTDDKGKETGKIGHLIYWTKIEDGG